MDGMGGIMDPRNGSQDEDWSVEFVERFRQLLELWYLWEPINSE